MQADLHSSTDAAHHVLYDPSVQVRIADQEDIEAAAETGALLPMYTAADGALEYRLVVDEELPAELRERVSRTTGDVLLRVPSGRLVASGLEYAGDLAQAETSVDLPAGNYLADVHELDFDWDRDIAPVLHRELGGRYQRELRVGPLGGFLFFAGICAAIVGLVMWSWRVIAGGVTSVALGLAVLRLGLPGRDYEVKKQAIARRYPYMVIVLRRLPDDADLTGYKGQLLDLTGYEGQLPMLVD